MKIIEVLKEQLDKEIKSAEQNLTASNLDAIYKLTAAVHCLEKAEKHHAEKEGRGLVEKYSNGKYDHNIDALYDCYVEAKRKYREVGDQGHRDKLMECLCRLMTEVYDMLSCVCEDADFRAERDELMKHIRRLADA